MMVSPNAHRRNFSKKCLLENKTRTLLLIMTDQEVKRTSLTKINSQRIDEFKKAFDSHVVELKQETYLYSQNLLKGQIKSESLRNNKFTTKELASVQNSNNKQFDSRYCRRRTSIANKKLQFFNAHFIVKSNNELGDEYDGLRPIVEQPQSEQKRTSTRKVSIFKLKEKIQEALLEKKEKKFEKGQKGFNFLQNLCSSLKADKQPRRKKEKSHRNSLSAKSYDRSEIKMLTDLMKNLQDNLSKSKYKSSNTIFTDEDFLEFYTENKIPFEHLETRTKKRVAQDIDNNNIYNKNKTYRGNSPLMSLKSSQISVDSCCKSNTSNSYRIIKSKSKSNLLQLTEGKENEFSINIQRCNFKSSNSNSCITENEKEYEGVNTYCNNISNISYSHVTAYTPLSKRDFSITLNNCMQNDDFELNSRKMSSCTYTSSVNDDM